MEVQKISYEEKCYFTHVTESHQGGKEEGSDGDYSDSV